MKAGLLQAFIELLKTHLNECQAGILIDPPRNLLFSATSLFEVIKKTMMKSAKLKPVDQDELENLYTQIFDLSIEILKVYVKVNRSGSSSDSFINSGECSQSLDSVIQSLFLLISNTLSTISYSTLEAYIQSKETDSLSKNQTFFEDPSSNPQFKGDSLVEVLLKSLQKERIKKQRKEQFLGTRKNIDIEDEQKETSQQNLSLDEPFQSVLWSILNTIFSLASVSDFASWQNDSEDNTQSSEQPETTFSIQESLLNNPDINFVEELDLLSDLDGPGMLRIQINEVKTLLQLE